MDGVPADLVLRVLKDPKLYNVFDSAVSKVVLFETNNEFQVKVGVYPGIPMLVSQRAVFGYTKHFTYKENSRCHVLFSRSIDPPEGLLEMPQDPNGGPNGRNGIKGHFRVNTNALDCV